MIEHASALHIGQRKEHAIELSRLNGHAHLKHP